MKRLAYLFGGAAALGAGYYLVVYLYRWQWQRAILCGVLLLVVEVLLVGVAVLDRLSRLESRVGRAPAGTGGREAEVLARVRQSGGYGRPPSGSPDAGPYRGPDAGPYGKPDAGPYGEPDGPAYGPATGGRRPRFPWLDEPGDPRTGRTHVFVPVLMVTGVVLSGLAWVVQRIAEATVRPGAERRLAGRLAPLTAPPLTTETGAPLPDLEDLPVLDRRSARRPWLVLGVVVAGTALLAVLIHVLADLTQTREERAESRASATAVLVRLEVRNASTAARADLAARQMWERCRDSTSVPLRHATLGELGEHLYAGMVHPALTPHDQLRLRGCLEDVVIERSHFTVVGIGQTDPDDD
ncbi:MULTISPECIES: hypothetical protein [unclassified Streptomyces]|uniref:hypothetical protein n=1 Tax=unclassified Streptomyces TaxID=2593676 RepID=UPI00336A7D64